MVIGSHIAIQLLLSGGGIPYIEDRPQTMFLLKSTFDAYFRLG